MDKDERKEQTYSGEHYESIVPDLLDSARHVQVQRNLCMNGPGIQNNNLKTTL